MSACVDLCSRTGLFVYTHVLYTRICASAYWEYSSSLITAQSWVLEAVYLWGPQIWQPLGTCTDILTQVLQILKTSGLTVL